MTRVLPYGSWPSPITATEIVAGAPSIDGARFVDDEVWWSEGLPAERGRTAILRDGSDEPVLAAPWSARSRVHEYGGGAWTADAEGALYFVEHSDQRVYRQAPGGEPLPLTPEGPFRHGDLRLVGDRVFAVRETYGEGSTPARDIVAIPVDGRAASDAAAIVSVIGGADFLAYPTPSPSGDRLAWVSWNHPDMPWDAATLHLGHLDASGAVVDDVVIAGGNAADGTRVAALQPEWVGDDELLFSADPASAGGRWNLFRVHLSGIEPVGTPASVAPADADTGGPLWNLGIRWYAPLPGGRVLAVRTHGRDELVVIDADGSVRPFETPLSGRVLLRDVRGARVLVTGAGVLTTSSLWIVDTDAETLTRVRGGADLDPAWLPRSRAVAFEGPAGTVHAFDYPPANPEAEGPEGEKPPYIVLAHGGPTTHVTGDASLAVAYFTSRGIGVLDVNYGGSTGYGRAYRERLLGQWGVGDVADVAAAARGLADEGTADGARLVVRGGSAGGWTVLCALANTDVFAAGISRYGVADLRALAADTHDFEARYLDGLVGALPEAEAVYVDRSPLSHPERMRAPMLILQGSDDAVVPPSQSLAVRDALVANGVAHAYVEYEGEAHGFRRAETIVHAFEAELSFLGQVLGFDTPGTPPLALA